LRMSQASTAGAATTESLLNDATIASSSNNKYDDSKLVSLRALMKERNIDVYLIPSDDPHLSGKVSHNGFDQSFLRWDNDSFVFLFHLS
jgi:hypothetical protein